MDAMNYELFIRSAFGLALGTRVGRLEDPAAFADTDTFSNSNLPAVKAGTGYAIGIYQNNIKPWSSQSIETCEDFLTRTMNAENITEISNLITTFNAEIIEKYYSRNDGVLIPKQ